MPSHNQTPDDRRISGYKVVAAMFTLGIVASGTLWYFWNLQMMPFMPLQDALVAEFENCSPRVDGGRLKGKKNAPKILRVIMRVPFDPTSSKPSAQDQIETRLNRTEKLAQKFVVEDDYEVLELHLFSEHQEQALRQKTFTRQFAGTAP
ncbi:MAG: hypothetical protein P8K08_22925 [Fuerstiella sp.]|jgi:hypothetical protein|nr:hypothetical protein [Fuerstiella sp.]